MPAKDTIHFALEPGAREALIEDLREVFIRGTLDGVDFMSRAGALRKTRAPAPRLSRSKIITQAIRYGAEACRGALLPVTPALPATTGTVDADRLKAARGAMSRAECARVAGLKDESSVRNVESRGMRLAGRLLAWVSEREALAASAEVATGPAKASP